jgi:hypothetical protein
MAAVLIGATASCARPDEVPSPDAEMQARIARLADALDAASDGRSSDMRALAEQLDNLCRFPPAESATRALAQALLDGVAGVRIARDARERMAIHLYSLMNGGYLPRRSLERVTLRMEQELMAAGVPQTNASDVRAAGIRVAREPRNPRTDWW